MTDTIRASLEWVLQQLIEAEATAFDEIRRDGAPGDGWGDLFDVTVLRVAPVYESGVDIERRLVSGPCCCWWRTAWLP